MIRHFRLCLSRPAAEAPLAVLIHVTRAGYGGPCDAVSVLMEEREFEIAGYAAPEGAGFTVVVGDGLLPPTLHVEKRGLGYSFLRAASYAARKARTLPLHGRITLPSPPPFTPGNSAAISLAIVIPTKDRAALLREALQSLAYKTSPQNTQIVIVDNGTTEPEALSLLAEAAQRPDVVVLRDPEPFNFARLINRGVGASGAEMIVILNNDVSGSDEHWASRLAALAAAPDVGAVGPRLVYPNGTLQHAGVVLGVGGLVGHSGRGLVPQDQGPGGMLHQVRQVSAVTGACLVVRRAVFEALGGFDERYGVECNDIDFCLRALAAGYRNVWSPWPILVHREGSSRGLSGPLGRQVISDRTRFIRQWGAALARDPHFPSHLSRATETLPRA